MVAGRLTGKSALEGRSTWENIVTQMVGSLASCQEQMTEACKIIMGSLVTVWFLQHRAFSITEVSVILLLYEKFCSPAFQNTSR
jgi:hypothetical protein